MKTSDLKHRIHIQKNANLDKTDENGNPAVEDWQSITDGPIWAAKAGLSGRVFYAALAAHAEDNVLFTVRYTAVTSAVTTDMRITEGSKTYLLTAPPTDVKDKHQWLEIHAKELI